MAEKITSFLQRRVLVSMLFLGPSLLGYISYKQLPLELLPYVEPPFLLVQVSSVRDMDPKYLEREALIPLESAAGTLESVEKIESYAGDRRGVIYITYNSNTNMKYAFLKLQEKVDAVAPSLASDFFAQVIKIDTQDLSNLFMNLQVRGSGGTDRIRSIIDKAIRKEFESIDGIANVEVFGGRLAAVSIELDNERSESYGITPARIRSLIAQYRQSTTFVGTAKNQQLKTAVMLNADYTSINDLENIVVDPGRGILLKDIADIKFAAQEQTSLSRINGKEAVTIQLIRDTQVNLIDLANETRSVIKRLNHELAGQDIEITIEQDSAEILEDNINLIINLALWGGLLAIIILWYFLRNLRLVFIIGLTIPISVLIAFNFFYAFDISLNSLTLVGIALAIGMLLDNSIVILENIFRHVQKDNNYLHAVSRGTRQMARSVSAATLTTVAVFLPFVFAENYIVRFIGYQIAVSIISTLMISLLAALVLIPVAAYYFLSKSKNPSQSIQFSLTSGKFLPFYNLILKTMLRFPIRTVVLTLITFITTVSLALLLGITASNDVELEDFNLYVTMPEGATLDRTDLAVQELEKKFSEVKELQDVVSQVYEQEAILTLKLKEDYKEIDGRSIADVKGFINDIIRRYHTAVVSFDQPVNSERFSRRGGGGQGGPSMGNGLMSALGISAEGGKVIITGKDFDLMRLVSDDIQGALEDLSSVDQVRNNATRERPEIHLVFDRQLLSRLGIGLSEISGELSSFENEVSTGMTYKDGQNEYDIIIRNANLEEKTREDLNQLNIQSQSGAVYPLGDISKVIVAKGSAGINRVNQERRIELNYDYIPEVNSSSTLLQAAQLEVNDAVQGVAVTPGITVRVEDTDIDLSDFYFIFTVAFLLIYMILASVFESLLKPFIIMFTIPLAAIGSLWVIIVSGNSIINVNVLIGLLILLGIVVNNGIILIDYIQQLRRTGMGKNRAIFLSGQARLRPIIITALTTIMAMIPLALGDEQYVTRIAAPFAITVIGGLSLSTLFTLVFIPAVYSGLENAVNWFNSLRLSIRILQIVLFIVGAALIWFNIDALLWRFAVFFALLFAIPGLTYFITHSLRRARTDYINADEKVIIKINNIYKMYEQPGRFVKEWRRKRVHSLDEKANIPFLDLLVKHIWKVILLVFTLYFVYFYLESIFWIVVTMHIVYALVIHLSGVFLRNYMNKTRSPENNIKTDLWLKRVQLALIWGVPTANLLFIFFILDSTGGLIFMGLVWYTLLVIYMARQRYQNKIININKIRGRFAGVRKLFYQSISVMPFFGRTKTPFPALKGVSLDISSGMFGLLGPNGAGKTTLMRIICGILDQSYGTISINDLDINIHREELQGLIGYLPQEFGMYENLTAYELLNYLSVLKGLYDEDERKERIAYVLKAVHLEKQQHQKIASFSGGMKQRIGIAQTLLHLPRILVVDEPTAGLDPRERIRFRNLLVELSRERVVIFSTHIIEDIASSCDRVAILNEGQLCYLGVPQEMTDEAQGKVWQSLMDEKVFNDMSKRFDFVHHTRLKEGIRVRILAKDKPVDNATEVNPTLEDAYLWLLKGVAATGMDG